MTLLNSSSFSGATEVKTKKKPELLAPAGSYECFEAALAAGADAVYLGVAGFNARAFAKGFSYEEAEKAFSLARLYGRKIYITLNTLVYNREFRELGEHVRDLASLGAHTFIIQDPGVAIYLKKIYPSAVLHASTQMSCASSDAADFIKNAGFTRMVAPRELSRSDLAKLCASGIEIEAFIHGALCVSVSGQCLMSSIIGRRSGNRGECAQPCRMKYSASSGGGYPLSLKDLCMGGHIKELAELGVSSFKIEGRMKSADYVFGVTSIYRKAIDEGRDLYPDEIARLARLFCRGGSFTDDYYMHSYGQGTLGTRDESDKSATRAQQLQPFAAELPKIPVCAAFELYKDKPSRLEFTARGVSVSVKSDAPSPALTSPLNRESVCVRIAKLGGTPFTLDYGNSCFNIGENLNMSPSVINAMRREAASALTEALSRFSAPECYSYPDYIREARHASMPAEPRIRFVFDSCRVPNEALLDSLSDIAPRSELYLPLFSPIALYSHILEANLFSVVGAYLPSIYFDSEKEAISVRTALLSASGVKDVLAGSPSYVTALAGTGMKLHGGYRLNIINSLSAEFYASAGFCDLTVSPELSDPAVSSLASPVPLAAMICGRLPLMLLQSCVIANETGCDKRFSDPVCGASCRRLFELRDRTGARFTAVPQFGHRNAILNSQLSYRADTLRGRADIFTVLFTTESDSEALCLAKLIVSGGKPESYTRR